MKNYKYFENVEKNAYFTETPCQFCGGKHLCLDGIFFEKDDLESICLDCFEKKQIHVAIPDYIKARVKNDADSKCEELQFNPRFHGYKIMTGRFAAMIIWSISVNGNRMNLRSIPRQKAGKNHWKN